MKLNRMLSVLALAGGMLPAVAQESVPPDQLAKVAPRLAARVADFADLLPLSSDAQPAQAFAMKAKDYVVLLMPDKGLTSESLARLGPEIKPVGQLWLARLTPVVQGKPAANGQLRLVSVTLKEEDHRLPMLLLGIRKLDGQGAELVGYGRGKEPLLVLPLKPREEPGQTLPLELTMRPGGEALGLVDIRILGRYEATLPVAEQGN